MREYLASVWLDYINNYLTLETFAEHQGLTEDEAFTLVMLAKQCHEIPHPEA